MVQCDEAAFFKPLKPLKKARHWCAVHLCRLYRKCLSEALFDRVTSIAFLEVLFPWDLVHIYFLVCWEAGIYQLVQDNGPIRVNGAVSMVHGGLGNFYHSS